VTEEESTSVVNIDNPFFEIPVRGRYTRGQVNVIYGGEEIQRPPEVIKQIDREWEKQLAAGKKLSNNELLILLDRKVQDGRLTLKLGNGYYKDYVGTYDLRMTHPEWAPQLLTTATCLETADGFLVLNERKEVFKYPGWVGSFGGVADKSDVNEEGNIDPFKTAIRETSEEAGIPEEDLTEIVCMGVMRDPKTNIEVVLFRSKTNLTKEEIEQGQNTDKQEGSNIYLPIEEEKMKLKALDFAKTTVTDALAVVALVGEEKFGDEWLDHLIKRLKRRGDVYASLSEEQRKEIESRKIERVPKSLK